VSRGSASRVVDVDLLESWVQSCWKGEKRRISSFTLKVFITWIQMNPWTWLRWLP